MASNSDVPATSKPMICKKKDAAGAYCGRLASDTISQVVNIMGKEIKVRVPLCPVHVDEAIESQVPR